jgi:hypothetical protein
MELLLLAQAFGWMVALLASATAVIVWASIRIARSLKRFLGDAEKSKRRPPRPASQWDPNHPLFSKRAGQ